MFSPLLIWILVPLCDAAATVLGQQNVLDFKPPDLDWKLCGEALHCANLTVPMDWENPENGKTIVLYMNKLDCKNPKQRIGSLIYNPGGPGGSGSSGVHQFLEEVGNALLERFDLIGLDPRGVGFSSPLNCNDTIKDSSPLQAFPVTQKDFDAQKAENVAFAQSCLELSGEIVKHIDTINVAKDLEATRIALGDQKLNYFGISYGTMIASTYASLFPKNIRAIVMDGNLDHTTDRVTAWSTEATGFEQCFNRFADWCAKNETCVLYNTTAQGGARGYLTNITNIADKTGYNFTSNCEPVGCKEQLIRAPGIIRGVRNSLYDPDYYWTKLAEGLNETVVTGDPSSLEGGPDSQEQPSPRYLNRTTYVFAPVACLDWKYATTVAEFQELEQLGRALGPNTRGCSNMWELNKQCVGWPFSVKGALNKEIKVSEDVSPILVVQSTYDPATAFQGAVNLHRQIPKSVLLIRDGDGHSSYPVSGGIRKIVDAYLVNGTLPKPNTVITSDSLGKGYGS